MEREERKEAGKRNKVAKWREEVGRRYEEQAFIKGAGTDLQEERRWEPVEGFDLSQPGQDDVHILSRALRGPGQGTTIRTSNISCCTTSPARRQR
ncbi:hypothetical protein EYF80_011698 [Liparis tanakae]|uniref:Uncharacterized protein n=1 Tax=Liparis tanakae TaxID=230148 RepID=A0A4Z2IM08_9TELE|nr:hypothetical protein EYF80_011698 [Liparis tanakae]